MIIRLAEVRESFDPQREGNFLAKLQGVADGDVSVKLTSQYLQGGNAVSKFPPPTPGILCLVTQPEGCGDWYYISSTGMKGPDNEKTSTDPLTDSNPLSDNSRHSDRGGALGAATGKDTGIAIQNDLGVGLELKQDRSKKGQNILARIYTPQEKEVRVDDSSDIDAIVLDTKRGSSLRLTGHPSDPTKSPERMLKVDTMGPQKYLNHESQTDIVVMDGRELNVLNYSTGKNAPAGENFKNQFGNVNLQSKYNDINIFSTQPYIEDRDVTDGRVFIECLHSSGYEQVIQIQTHGEGIDENNDGSFVNACVIRVLSSNKIEIQSTTNLDVSCGGTINMKADGDINITAGGDLNLSAGGNTNADSTQIHLNSGESTPATPFIGDTESFYGRAGITTYK